MNHKFTCVHSLIWTGQLATSTEVPFYLYTTEELPAEESSCNRPQISQSRNLMGKTGRGNKKKTRPIKAQKGGYDYDKKKIFLIQPNA